MKPTVHFRASPNNHIVLGQRAWLQEGTTDHWATHRVSNKGNPVTTSRVISLTFVEEGGEVVAFETLNTLYVLEGSSQ